VAKGAEAVVKAKAIRIRIFTSLMTGVVTDASINRKQSSGVNRLVIDSVAFYS